MISTATKSNLFLVYLMQIRVRGFSVCDKKGYLYVARLGLMYVLSNRKFLLPCRQPGKGNYPRNRIGLGWEFLRGVHGGHVGNATDLTRIFLVLKLGLDSFVLQSSSVTPDLRHHIFVFRRISNLKRQTTLLFPSVLPGRKFVSDTSKNPFDVFEERSRRARGIKRVLFRPCLILHKLCERVSSLFISELRHIIPFQIACL